MRTGHLIVHSEVVEKDAKSAKWLRVSSQRMQECEVVASGFAELGRL